MEIHPLFIFLSKWAAVIGHWDHAHTLIFCGIALGLLAVGGLLALIEHAGKPIKKKLILENTNSTVGFLDPEPINPISDSPFEIKNDSSKEASMGIYIVRSGTRAGPFTQKQIEDMLKSNLL
jgi:hypothetical protein